MCAAKRDPRLGGCTPPRPPKRKSEVSAAKRTQYYCPFLTPPSLPPLLSREFPRTPAVFNGCYNLGRSPQKAPLSKGAGRVSGLGDSDGPCLIARYPRRRPGIPPPRYRSAPPFDKGGFSRGLRPRKKAPHYVGSWLSLARPEGLCRALRYHALTGTHLPPQKRLPPSPDSSSPLFIQIYRGKPT